jgi:penicillin G amidase
MNLNKKWGTIQADKGEVRIKRMGDGFPHIDADEETDLFFGLGFAHGYDRRMHMWLLKTICHGRASEYISSDENLIELDRYMRWINLGVDTASEIEKLSNAHMEILTTYCRGVNKALQESNPPIESRLIGYRPDPWAPEDCLNMIKTIGFMGLAQSQGQMEKFIIQMIKNDVAPQKIRELFPAIDEEIPDDLVNVIKKLQLIRPMVPESLQWANRLFGMTASNNWVIGPKLTGSGFPILCGDPHLAVQLPSIWYNTKMTCKKRFLMGGTMPGMPALVLGRTPDLAWAVTYSPADASDYFIEEVRNGKYRHGDEWKPLERREETLHPKKKAPIMVTCFENHHGLIEKDTDDDGYFLCYAWASRKGTAAETLKNFFNLMQAKDVKEAGDYFAGLTFAPFNWIMADTSGNIGYQMSGRIPKKIKGGSGLLPYPGWKPEHDWQGFEDASDHPRVINPSEGFIVTANQDLNHLGIIKPIKLPMPAYRSNRIADLIREGKALTIEDMKIMHYDLYSLQAETFMNLIRPILPDTENAKILNNWDCRYDADSLGATLFERIYSDCMDLVFGEMGFGNTVMKHIVTETPLFAFLHGFFDDILFNESPAWFGDRSRDKVLQQAIERGLEDRPVPYGKTRRVFITNLFFGGRLPNFLGFDYGPHEHIGSRATIPQAQIFKDMGHPASFAPSYRMITDLGENVLHTNLAGGPSERRFSRYYTKGLGEWIKGEYHIYDSEI